MQSKLFFPKMALLLALCASGRSAGRLTAQPSAYLRLVAATRVYRGIARRGGWPTLPYGPILKRGDRGGRVALLRKRLLLCGELRASRRGRRLLFDMELERALEHYQRDNGLEATGEVDEKTLHALNIPVQARLVTMEANLERARGMPIDWGSRYLLVDIPKFQVRAYESHRPVLSMRAIVGEPGKETALSGYFRLCLSSKLLDHCRGEPVIASSHLMRSCLAIFNPSQERAS